MIYDKNSLQCSLSINATKFLNFINWNFG